MNLTKLISPSRAALAAIAAAMLSGCAGIGANAFYANPSAASPFEMCKTLATGNPDMDFANALRMELGRRGVAEASCPSIIENRHTAVAVGATVGAIALAVAASKHSNMHVGVGATIGGYGGPIVADHDWAWDQYPDASGGMIWACRSRQTAEVVDPSRCEGKPMTDSTWPGTR